MAKLIEKEKNVKVVLKELPILSKGSEEAAKVALAAKMQGKYWEFHRAMLSASGQANEASALRIAEKVGADMAKLKTDMASPEVTKEIDDTRALGGEAAGSGARRSSWLPTASFRARRRTCWSRWPSTSPRCARSGCKVC